MKFYTKEHQWVEMQGALTVVGITPHAASELGDITFIELPAIGKAVKAGDALCVVESVKAASDVFAPVSGVVAEVNLALDKDPGIINEAAEGAGWICRLKSANPAELKGLMTAEQYAASLVV